MDKLFESAPNIIGEAAKSSLGIFALMILGLSILGFFFFRHASEKTRIGVFVLMLVGVTTFGYATFRSASQGIDGHDASSAEPVLTSQFSQDRDHPTKLKNNEIRGTGIDRGDVSYFLTFIGGPGDIKVTLDFTAEGLNQAAEVTLFDREWNKFDDVGVRLNPGNERVVKHVKINQQQVVIAEVHIESFASTAGSFMIRFEGAVKFL